MAPPRSSLMSRFGVVPQLANQRRPVFLPILAGGREVGPIFPSTPGSRAPSSPCPSIHPSTVAAAWRSFCFAPRRPPKHGTYSPSGIFPFSLYVGELDSWGLTHSKSSSTSCLACDSGYTNFRVFFQHRREVPPGSSSRFKLSSYVPEAPAWFIYYLNGC